MILKKMKILETKQFNAKSEVNKQMQSAGCLFTGGRGRGGRAGLLSQKFCCHHKFAETDFEEEAEKRRLLVSGGVGRRVRLLSCADTVAKTDFKEKKLKRS